VAGSYPPAHIKQQQGQSARVGLPLLSVSPFQMRRRDYLNIEFDNFLEVVN
jgi:hypothetical protein